MNILVDTNVILDLLLDRMPFADDSEQIMELGRTGDISCAFTANSAADIFYIYSKSRGNKAANRALTHLVSNLGVVAVTKADCVEALAHPNEDFEDALVEVCAKKIGADFIVSRDDEFIAAVTEIRAIKPNALIEQIKRQ
jgi:predicted nucleic acid-binding protein